MDLTPRARALLAEIIRRRRAREAAARDDAAKCARLRALAFAAQLAFIDDASKKKAARCTRRAGKTALAAIYLLLVAFAKPESTCLYLALTRQSAKRLVWRWLKKLNKLADLGLGKRAFNEIGAHDHAAERLRDLHRRRGRDRRGAGEAARRRLTRS
jgi:hypothetical protein